MQYNYINIIIIYVYSIHNRFCTPHRRRTCIYQFSSAFVVVYACLLRLLLLVVVVVFIYQSVDIRFFVNDVISLYYVYIHTYKEKKSIKYRPPADENTTATSEII